MDDPKQNSKILSLLLAKRIQSKKFVELAFRELDIEVEWHGEGINKIGKNSLNGATIVRVDPKYFRPNRG